MWPQMMPAIVPINSGVITEQQEKTSERVASVLFFFCGTEMGGGCVMGCSMLPNFKDERRRDLAPCCECVRHTCEVA